MAPEQAKRKSVDKRADIWSFGVVLHELLTGEPLFQGEDISDTLAQVLTRQPDLGRVPAPARPLLTECLRKDPKQRLRDIGDAKRLLGEEAVPAAVTARPSRRPVLAWTVVALAMACAAVLGLLQTRRTAPPMPTFTFTVRSPEDEVFGGFAISPDGTMLAMPAVGASEGARWQISSGGGIYPRWSPDGKELFYISADSKMTVVPVNAAAGFQYGAPKPLFATPYHWGARVGFAVSRDGHRFLIPTRVINRSEVTVVTNWLAAARK
jgi:eukaryotic-like serine/threonine-protein kinase